MNETPTTRPTVEPLNLYEATHRFQRRLVVEALAAAGGVAGEAAKRLQVSRNTISRILNMDGDPGVYVVRDRLRRKGVLTHTYKSKKAQRQNG